MSIYIRLNLLLITQFILLILCFCIILFIETGSAGWLIQLGAGTIFHFIEVIFGRHWFLQTLLNSYAEIDFDHLKSSIIRVTMFYFLASSWMIISCFVYFLARSANKKPKKLDSIDPAIDPVQRYRVKRPEDVAAEKTVREMASAEGKNNYFDK